jgi:hypothetical protein
MSNISLFDLLTKSANDIKKQVINPFFDDKISDVNPVNKEILSKVVDDLCSNVSQSRQHKETYTQHLPTSSTDQNISVSGIKQTILKNRRYSRVPEGLETVRDVPVQESYSDDPNLNDWSYRLSKSENYKPEPVGYGSVSTSDDSVSYSEPHSLNDERDTPEDMFRDQHGLKPKRHKPIPKESLHGGEDRDTIEDVIRDRNQYIPNQDDDDDIYLEPINVKGEDNMIWTVEEQDIQVPNEIKSKMFATNSRSTFVGVGIEGKHNKGDTVKAHDGNEYKIINITKSNNSVHLRCVNTGYSSRTSYNKFFGIHNNDFAFKKGDLVKYYNPSSMSEETYEVVGLNPASNNVQLLMGGKKKFIRATKVSLVYRKKEDPCAVGNE